MMTPKLCIVTEISHTFRVQKIKSIYSQTFPVTRKWNYICTAVCVNSPKNNIVNRFSRSRKILYFRIDCGYMLMIIILC